MLALSLLCASLTACGAKPFEYASTLTAIPNETTVSLDITGNVNLPDGTVVELKATTLRDGYQEIYDSECVSETGIVRDGIINSLNEMYLEWTSESIETTVTNGTYNVSIPLSNDIVLQSYEVTMECDFSEQGGKQTQEVMKIVGNDGKNVLNYQPTLTTIAYPNEDAVKESSEAIRDEIAFLFSWNQMMLLMAPQISGPAENIGRDFDYNTETSHFQFIASNELIENLKTVPNYKTMFSDAWDSAYFDAGSNELSMDTYYMIIYNTPAILDIFDENGTLIGQRINGEYNWTL